MQDTDGHLQISKRLPEGTISADMTDFWPLEEGDKSLLLKPQLLFCYGNPRTELIRQMRSHLDRQSYQTDLQVGKALGRLSHSLYSPQLLR